MKSSVQFIFFALSALVALSSGFQSPLSLATRPISCGNILAMSEEPSAAESTPEEAPAKPDVKCPNCDMCDGSGRIAGGIGAVVPWIPIKAFRPCPNFIENGGSYERMGQGLDEIAFGKNRD